MANTKSKQLATSKLPKRQAVGIAPRMAVKVGRNEPCPCGSGKKYKDCHVGEGEAFLHKLALEKAKELVREKRQQLKADGVPWYRRLFV